MTMKDDLNNWRIELREDFYMPVCRSPKGSRCLKVLESLKAKEKTHVELMFRGYWKSKCGEVINLAND